jgi:polyphosphate kinase 2 (PPK2 family)
MKKSEIIDRSRQFAEPYCVSSGKKFRLKDFDPAGTGKATSEDKPRAKELLETGIQALAELQNVLYAQDRWSVLLVFQAMDAAGKDGAIASLNLQYPEVTEAQRKELAAASEALMAGDEL